MSHYKSSEWRVFIKDQLVEPQRAQMENHLYTCDICLTLYMKVMDEASTHLPSPQSSEDYADQILNVIQKGTNNNSPTELPPTSTTMEQQVVWYQRTLVQYAVAASITIVLMTAGVFQGVSKQVEKLQYEVIAEKDNSLSERFMNKTLSFLDAIQSRTLEGGSNPNE